MPHGFGGRYTAEYNKLLASLDTRRPLACAGLRLARARSQAEQGSDVRTSASGWIRYGAAASGFLDLDQHGRVVSLSAATVFADPLGGGPIPFTELVSLGGDGPMRGYFLGRLVDRSAATAALRYVWPIGPWLGGNIEAAVGNVFGEHLQGFRPTLLRFSGDVGITDDRRERLPHRGHRRLRHGDLRARRADRLRPRHPLGEPWLLNASSPCLALALTACAAVDRPFPLRAPLWRDTDLSPVTVACHRGARQEGPRARLVRARGRRLAPSSGTAPTTWSSARCPRRSAS